MFDPTFPYTINQIFSNRKIHAKYGWIANPIRSFMEEHNDMFCSLRFDLIERPAYNISCLIRPRNRFKVKEEKFNCHTPKGELAGKLIEEILFDFIKFNSRYEIVHYGNSLKRNPQDSFMTTIENVLENNNRDLYNCYNIFEDEQIISNLENGTSPEEKFFLLTYYIKTRISPMDVDALYKDKEETLWVNGKEVSSYTCSDHMYRFKTLQETILEKKMLEIKSDIY